VRGRRRPVGATDKLVAGQHEAEVSHIVYLPVDTSIFPNLTEFPSIDLAPSTIETVTPA
jgi:hypothetical protein